MCVCACVCVCVCVRVCVVCLCVVCVCVVCNIHCAHDAVVITGAKSAVDSSTDDSDDSSSDEDLDSESEHSDEEDYCFMVSTAESIQSYVCNASILQSRAVRNSLPFFIWTCRRDDFLCRNLRKVKCSRFNCTLYMLLL